MVLSLPSNLRIRWSTQSDTDAIASCVADGFRDAVTDPPRTSSASAVRRLMRGDNPFMQPADFCVVQDVTTGEIVACTCLFSQEMEYGQLSLRIGRPDHVVTRWAHREQGLSKVLLETVHERSQERGDLLTLISGIPFYYRRFGYEYALDFGASKRTMVAAIASDTQADEEEELFKLKEATLEDVTEIERIFETHRTVSESPVWLRPPPGYFAYQIDGWTRPGADLTVDHMRTVLMIDDTLGISHGFVVISAKRSGASINVLQLAWDPQTVELPSFSFWLLRALARYGRAMPSSSELTSIGWWFSGYHPIYQALSTWQIHTEDHPFSFLIRASDPAAFLHAIRPTLDARLLSSPVFRYYTGRLRISFFVRRGIQITFSRGQIENVEGWIPGPPGSSPSPDASFPYETFWQVVFGRRTVAELRSVLPDVECNEEEMEKLLGVLFPRKDGYFAHFV